MQFGLGNGQVANLAVLANSASNTTQTPAASSLPMLSTTTAQQQALGYSGTTTTTPGPSQTVRSDSVDEVLDDIGNGFLKALKSFKSKFTGYSWPKNGQFTWRVCQ